MKARYILLFLVGLVILLSLNIGGNSCTVNDRDIKINIRADLDSIRHELIQFIWDTAGFPTQFPSQVKLNLAKDPNYFSSEVVNNKNLERIDELQIAMEGGPEGLAYHFIPVRKNNQLVIVHTGHWCVLPFDIINALLDEGYSALVVFMPRINPKDCNPIEIHSQMFSENPKAMKYFLEPTAVCLNYLKTNYNIHNFPHYASYHMTGLSGGGWATTIYAALDTTIQFSFPIAGSIPIYLRSGKSIGDEEQNHCPFYRIAGYPDLYVMGSFGKGRRQVQILNRRDDCCFGEAQHDPLSVNMSYTDAMRGVEMKVRNTLYNLGSGSFMLEIDEAAKQHRISNNTIFNIILSELNSGGDNVVSYTKEIAFERGMNGNLWHRSSSSWLDTGIPIVGDPAVLEQLSTNNYDVFARDNANNLVHIYFNSNKWICEIMPDSKIITNPTATSGEQNRWDVVALNNEFQLCHWWFEKDKSIKTELISNTVQALGPLTMTTNLAGKKLDIFFKGWDRSLWHYSSSDSSPWSLEKVGGIMLDFPSAVNNTGNTIRVYVRDQSAHLWEARKTEGDIWKWTDISQATNSNEVFLSGSPSVTMDNGGITVYQRTSQGTLAKYLFMEGAKIPSYIESSGGAWSMENYDDILTDTLSPNWKGAFVRGKSGNLGIFDGQN